jgi:hypothetical protein
MRDIMSTKQVVVMNDRTQAGTAGIDRKSTIELIQQRRILHDDNKGVDEPLNERNFKGYGLKVTAKYFM